jgi:PE family
MSFVIASSPEMAAAAGGLFGIGASVLAANAAAAPVHAAVVPPAADELSALHAFAHQAHAANYQAMQAIGSMFHEMFASTMGVSAASYAGAEAVNMGGLL